MSPRVIVDKAYKRGLDLLAVTDHNACDNLPYVKRLAEAKGMTLIPGMELQTEEEVHLLAYFEDLETVFAFKDRIYSYLPDVENDPDYFGDQVIVDEEDNIVGIESKLLINSLMLSLDQCVELVKEHGGVAIPAHVNREPFGIIGQLGFIPEYLGFDAVEVCSRTDVSERVLVKWPDLKRYALITSSDAHFPNDIGRVFTLFLMENPCWSCFRDALHRGEAAVLIPKFHERSEAMAKEG